MAVLVRKKTQKEKERPPELVQVRKKAQITLPRSVMKDLGINEGDYISIRVENGEAVVKPMTFIDKDQAWFWTRRWQEGERDADEDIRAGRVHSFDNVEDAIAHLHERARKYDAEQKAAKTKKAAK
jgi:AbrB family looped-hinge helix DNA binding protein